MKYLIAFALLFTAPAYADDPMRICHFSLNSDDEFRVTKDFLGKLNKASPTQVTVEEFMPLGGDPNKAFLKMVESGVRCDGLVISGHHTGSYGGHRAKGKLSMDFMESLSCNPKHAAFFQNLNAAWLQGCRTLGVGEIQADDEQGDADFHTNRVGQVVEEDGLTQSFAELNMEFSNTLDQDNPLASRYLRLFPNAKLFGWTRSAPGEKSRSYMSLLYHMAQTSKRLEADDKFPFDAPDAGNMSAASAARFADAMLLTLTRFSVEQKGCEEIATGGWLSHGNVDRPGKYFFDNPDLKAYSSLASTGDKALLEAKELDCALKGAANAMDPAAMAAVLDRIVKRPDFLRYSFNTIVDLRQRLAGAKDAKGKETAAIILDKMKQDPKVLEFLKGKMSSRQVGLTRKIDYYKFYNALTGQKDEAVEKELQARAIAELAKPLPPLNPTAHNPARSRNLAAEYRATVVQAMIKNKVAGPTFYDEMLAKNPEADVLKSLALQVRNYVPGGRVQRLLAIVGSPAANEAVEVAAWKEIQAMKLDEGTMEKVQEHFIQAREARPVRRDVAAEPAPATSAPSAARRGPNAPPQRDPDILDRIGNVFGF